MSRRDRTPSIIKLPEGFLGRVEHTRERIRQRTQGKYLVLGIDKYDGTDWVHGRYNTPKEALAEARKRTIEAMKSASDASIATVYYAYDPQGKYLGGDTWYNE